MNEDEKKELITKKANYYLNEKRIVHITNDSDKFYNGLIKYVGADFILIDDRKLGEVCLFYFEIKDLEPYEERKEDPTEHQQSNFYTDDGKSVYQP